MVSTRQAAKDVKTVTLLATAPSLYADVAPFFESHVRFESNASKAGCLFCESGPLAVGDDTVAITYNLERGRFAHTACLRKIPGASISTDKKLKAKAQKAAKERLATQREATRAAKATLPAATPAVDVDALRAEIRAEIAAEYEDRMAKAIEVIQDLQAQNATLQAAADKKAVRRAALVSK